MHQTPSNVRLVALLLAASALLCSAPRNAGAQADLLDDLGGSLGFGYPVLTNGDDAPSYQVRLDQAFPSGLNFFGRVWSEVWININGNLTFGTAYSIYTPEMFPISNVPMIAPWWGDVDLRGGGAHNQIYFHADPIGQRIIVTWWEVGYYASHTDKVNSFQLILTHRPDLNPGDFDVEFRYHQLEWTTGDVTGTNGFGGSPAVAGFDSGNHRDYTAIPGSYNHAVIYLTQTSNVAEPGVWRWSVRSGLLSVCGDGRVNEGEQCDTGPSRSDVEPDHCRMSCLLFHCGDGVVDFNEQCDEGDANGTGECSQTCELAELCGNGLIETGEGCDDGLQNSDVLANHCRTTCQLPYCGDGIPDAGETCDDGDQNGEDGRCSLQCDTAMGCGNGRLDPGEACDDGRQNSDVLANHCRTDCRLPTCGDGITDAGEACDTGVENGTGSGCSSSCQLSSEPEMPLARAEAVVFEDDSPTGRRLGTYWAERTVPVLMRRRYLTSQRHSLTLNAGLIPTDPLFDFYPVGLRYHYYPSEYFGLELGGSYIGDTFRSTSGLTDFLVSAGAQLDFQDVPDWRAWAGVRWSPWYAKISFLAQKLVHFELVLMGGAGVLANQHLDANQLPVSNTVTFEGNVGAGATLFLSRDASLQLEFRQYLSPADEGGLAHPSEVSLGFTIYVPFWE